MLVLHVPQPRSGMAVAAEASVWLPWAMVAAVTAAECEGAAMLFEMLCVWGIQA